MTTETTEDNVRVLKTATCPSLSGKSKLTYDIGCKADSQIMVRVHGNSGEGFFNKDWVGLAGLSQLLAKLPVGKAITSATFKPVLRGKSTNTAGFLLAVLKHEGLVRALKDKSRTYELLDAKEFMARVQELITAPAADKKAKTAAPTKKAAIQKQVPEKKPKKG